MSDFDFVSGNAGLDFAGTLQRRRTERRDLLTSPEKLAQWTVAAGILDVPPPVCTTAFEEAVLLREAIYRLAISTPEPLDRSIVNRAAARPPAGMQLRDDGSVARTGDLDAALSTLARAAVELLGGPLAARITECGGEACTRLYVDTSRGSSRRWCDMSVCGNRAKAAGFRARQRA